MNEVQVGDVFKSIEDERRRGSTRIVTVRAIVRAKRVYDKVKQGYARCLSDIVAYPNRPGIVGKKRKVFIKIKSLQSAQYRLLDCTPGQKIELVPA